jgi:hypothetical protein
MDLRFGCPGIQHPGDDAAPLVNLCQRAFDIGATLAAPDYGCFSWFRIFHK